MKYAIAGALIFGAMAVLSAVAAADPDMDAAVGKLNDAIAHLEEYERLDDERARNDEEYRRLQREAADAAREVAVYVETQRDNEQAAAGIGAGLLSMLGLGGLGTAGTAAWGLRRLYMSGRPPKHSPDGDQVNINVGAPTAGPGASPQFRQ